MIIEKPVIATIDKYTDFAAYAETPPDMPYEYFTVQRLGGGSRDMLRTAQIAVRAFSRNSKLRAAVMIEDAIKVLKAHLAETDGITSCKLNSSYDNTLTATKQYCFQAVFIITYMEAD